MSPSALMKRKLEDVTGSAVEGSRTPSRYTPLSRPQSSGSAHSSRPFPAEIPPNASIALVGLRGVGKSTIGVIVSSTLRRRLIDVDVHFVNVTGMSIHQYVSVHGWPGYRAKEAEITDEILRENSTNSIIVCSSGCVETASTRARLQEWMTRHPVVHILRHEKEVQAYLQPQSPASSPSQQPEPPLHVLRRLTARREPMYTSCSNLEFYNLWDKQQHPTLASGRYSPLSPTLKRVEQDFLRLLNFAFRREMAPLIVWDRHSPHPSSAAVAEALEERSYTYALTIPPTEKFGTIDRAPLGLEELGETVDAFDLRIDYLLHANKIPESCNPNISFISDQFAKVRRQSNKPIIYHASTAAQGGRLLVHPGNPHDENLYFSILYHGLRVGSEYLVVDLGFNEHYIRELISYKGSSKIIACFHDTREGQDWDSDARLRMYEHAESLGCDIVMLSQRARKVADNNAVIAFAWKINKRRAQEQSLGRNSPRLIAYNTGRLGKLSRFLNPILSPVTHPLLKGKPDQERDPGFGPYSQNDDEITPKEALSTIYASSILPRFNFCIFGSAIRHSLSPAMHNAAYEVYGMPHNYRICEAPLINQLLPIVHDPEFGGASVTLPFKLEVIPLLHTLSDHAQAIGAVNTIVPIRSGDGGDSNTPKALHGDNTDWIGIRTCALRYLTPVNAITTYTSALVVGAGGMARAAIYALHKIGVGNIFLCNRTPSRAIQLAEYFNGRNSAASSRAESPADTRCSPDTVYMVQHLPLSQTSWPAAYRLPTIIVSCIPAHSIQGHPPANFTVPDGWLASPTGGVCIELAYKPRVTPLLQQVRTLASRGWIGVDGLEVLPEQGYAQFELFLGREAPRRVMRDAVEEAYAKAQVVPMIQK
ncbi:type I 3-dehydroquinase-domain-containing protein [Geopyxis carbonaria]|nr:type I 3-dehydroquinase-domain-containing protein [Geopyxis carbonaria]